MSRPYRPNPPRPPGDRPPGDLPPRPLPPPKPRPDMMILFSFCLLGFLECVCRTRFAKRRDTHGMLLMVKVFSVSSSLASREEINK